MTPDSFFDGGKYRRVDAALKQAEKMVREGADILEVGGESSRPGSKPVSVQEELARVLPVVKNLIRKFPEISLSLDTRKSEVASRCLMEGVEIINDISALRANKNMIKILREFKPQVVLMHMRGTPQTMQNKPKYENVVDSVKRFLSGRVRWACENGLSREKIWIDPGIGFGKTVQHNLDLLKHLKQFFSLHCPLLVGCSRKFFIGSVLGNGESPLPAAERLEGSLAAAAWAFLQGVSVLRVHDVAATRRVIQLLQAIQRGGAWRMEREA